MLDMLYIKKERETKREREREKKKKLGEKIDKGERLLQRQKYLLKEQLRY